MDPRRVAREGRPSATVGAALELLTELANACGARGWDFSKALSAAARPWRVDEGAPLTPGWAGPLHAAAPWTWRRCAALIHKGNRPWAKRAQAWGIAGGEGLGPAWRNLTTRAGLSGAKPMDPRVFARLEEMEAGNAQDGWEARLWNAHRERLAWKNGAGKKALLALTELGIGKHGRRLRIEQHTREANREVGARQRAAAPFGHPARSNKRPPNESAARMDILAALTSPTPRTPPTTEL